MGQEQGESIPQQQGLTRARGYRRGLLFLELAELWLTIMSCWFYQFWRLPQMFEIEVPGYPLRFDQRDYTFIKIIAYKWRQAVVRAFSAYRNCSSYRS